MRFSKNYILLIFIALWGTHAHSRMDMRIAYNFFMSPDEGIYMETYFALNGNSIQKYQDKKGLFGGSVTVEVRAILGEKIIVSDKFRITLDGAQDSLAHNKFYFYNVKYPVSAGEGTLIFVLVDENDTTDKHEIDIDLYVPEIKNNGLSDVVFISQMPENQKLSKSDLVPIIPRGNYFFDKEVSSLIFYSEVYHNASDTSGNNPFLLQYSVEYHNSNKLVKGLSGFKKIQNQPVNPYLIGLNIESLPSGVYNLVVKTINRQNSVIDERVIKFYRASELKPQELDENRMFSLSLEESFLDINMPTDSFQNYLLYLLPLTGDNQQNTITRLANEKDKEKMHRYFLSFWQNRNPSDPQGAWEDYYRRVLFVNEKYKSRLMKGYRTDRGRIYLQYGPPTLTESRPFEPGTYPYEIWQYDQLVSGLTSVQSDRIFIFADTEINTNTYRLIHSTAAGETYNERWQQFLMKRDMMPQDVDETSLPAQSSDWGSRMNNNIIISPSKLGRYNRW